MSAPARRLAREDAVAPVRAPRRKRPELTWIQEGDATVVFHRFVRESMGDRAYQHSAGQGHLDFGCGRSRLGRFFLGEFRAQDMVGVDLDPDAVAACAEAGLPGGFETAFEGAPLSFETGQFRLITACGVFAGLPPESLQAWSIELLRVLAPGGLLAFTLDPASASAKQLASEVAPHGGEVVRYADDPVRGQAMVIVRKRGGERPRGWFARLFAGRA